MTPCSSTTKAISAAAETNEAAASASKSPSDLRGARNVFTKIGDLLEGAAPFLHGTEGDQGEATLSGALPGPLARQPLTSSSL